MERTKSLFISISSLIVFSLFLCGCDAELRKTDAQLGLNPQQSAGRKVYDNYCDRCHEPYSTRGKKGPGLKGIYKKSFFPASGMPANDDRMTDVIRYGREKMPGFGQVLSPQQVNDLIAYLHTL